MIIYVAGKYTAETPELIQTNVNYAKSYAIEIAKRFNNIAVIVPHLLYQDDWNLGYERYLEMDLQILDRCDACFLLPNYKNSKGALIEVEHCKKQGIPLVESLKEIEKLINK